jgi:glycosyltransferase involved in cell wall biosynthesis
VEDGGTGYLVPAEDAGALAERIGRLVLDPGLASRMGAMARRRVEERFTLRAMMEQTAAVYDEVLTESGNRVRELGTRIVR